MAQDAPPLLILSWLCDGRRVSPYDPPRAVGRRNVPPPRPPRFAVAYAQDLQRANRQALWYEKTAERDEMALTQMMNTTQTVSPGPADSPRAAMPPPHPPRAPQAEDVRMQREEYRLTELVEKKERLRQLLVEEQQMYELELRSMGLALAVTTD